MVDQDQDEPQDWNALYLRDRELRRPIDADYRMKIAPAKRRRDEDTARTEREFREKVQVAKTKLYHAQQEFEETTRTLTRWRDATFAAIERQFVNEKGPAIEEKRERMKSVIVWYNRQHDRLTQLQQQGST